MTASSSLWQLSKAWQYISIIVLYHDLTSVKSFPGFKGYIIVKWCDVIFWTYQTILLFLILDFFHLAIISLFQHPVYCVFDYSLNIFLKYLMSVLPSPTAVSRQLAICQKLLTFLHRPLELTILWEQCELNTDHSLISKRPEWQHSRRVSFTAWRMNIAQLLQCTALWRRGGIFQTYMSPFIPPVENVPWLTVEGLLRAGSLCLWNHQYEWFSTLLTTSTASIFWIVISSGRALCISVKLHWGYCLLLMKRQNGDKTLPETAAPPT